MRKTIFLSVLLLLVPLSATAATRTVTAESKVTAVTVYPSRAMVTRTATLELQPGDYRVVFDGLPPEMDSGSLRVSGSGDKGFRLGTVETDVTYTDASANPRVKELEEKIQSLGDDISLMQAKLSVVQQREKMFANISMHSSEIWSKELTVGSPSVDQWKQVTGFIDSGSLKAAEDEQKLNIDIREARKELDALNRQLGDIRTSAGTAVRSATVELSADTPGSVTLELGYLVSGAFWTPQYEARVNRKADELEILYKATVSQSTSEDWNGVTLSLSTARPSVGALPPEINPWYIDYLSPQELETQALASNQLYSRADLMEQKQEVAKVAGGAYAPEPTARMYATASGGAGTFVTFKAATKQDIPADGSNHSVNITDIKYKTLYRYIAVPKLSPYAFLKGFFTNDAGVPLLAGPVEVFHGSDYVGKSYLKQTADGEKVELALGVDEGIKVKRERVEMFEEDSGILSDKRRVNYKYRVKVENFKDAPQTVSVLDQLPVSQREEVTVKEVRIEPEPAVRKDGGVFKWEFKLNPGEKAEARLEFYVEFPKDAQLTGIEY